VVTSAITLPGSLTTLPGTTITTVQATTAIVTAPGSTVTLPGVVNTVTVPGSVFLTTILSVKTIPGSTFTTVTSKPTTITVPGSILTLPGQTTLSTFTVPPSTVVSTLPQTVESGIGTVTGSPSVSEATPTNNVVTSVSGPIVCPQLTVNPTFTPASPLPTDFTWGCPPGKLCHPRKSPGDDDCNFPAGPPADTYFCAPDECITSPPLPPPQFWGEPIVSNEIAKYNVTPGYYNLFPSEFGLGYDIFAFPNGTQIQKRALFNSLHRRQAQGPAKIPGQCYDECNNCMLEAESTGKTAELCSQKSAFEVNLSNCQKCIQLHGTGSKTTIGSPPEFQQFLSFCSSLPGGVQAQPVPESAGSGSGANGGNPPPPSSTGNQPVPSNAGAIQNSASNNAGGQNSVPSNAGGNQNSVPSNAGGSQNSVPSNAGAIQNSATGSQNSAPSATQGNNQVPNPSTGQVISNPGSSKTGAGASSTTTTNPLFTGAGSPSVIKLSHSLSLGIFGLVSLLNILL